MSKLITLVTPPVLCSEPLIEHSVELTTTLTTELILINPELKSHVIGQLLDEVLGSYVLGGEIRRCRTRSRTATRSSTLSKYGP